MKKFIVLFNLLLISTLLQAQITFHRNYGGNGGDDGKSIQQTNDNGFIIVGSTSSYGAGSSDVYLIKTNQYGDTLWTKTFGGSNSDEGESVQQTNDNGYIIAGSTSSFGNGYSNVYLIKTDENGNTLWTNTFGGQDYDGAYSVQQTSDNGYIITGYNMSFNNDGFSYVYLVKTDSLGNSQWGRVYGGASDDEGHSVQQTDDGGYIIAGYTASFGADVDDVYLIKTDEFSNVLWAKTYGGYNFDQGYSVQQTNDGGYIIAGYTSSFSADDDDVYLIKTDELGDTLWTKIYDGYNFSESYSVQQTNDNGYIIAGDAFTGTSTSMLLIKTDENGNLLWTRTNLYGGRSAKAYSVKQTNDNGYIITGSIWIGNETYSDLCIIKTNADGIVTSVEQSPNNTPEQFYLDQNYPNPFNPSTGIQYAVSNRQFISLKVYDVLGNEVAVLVNEEKPAGTYKVNFDAGNLPSGVYLYQLRAGNFIQTKKNVAAQMTLSFGK